MVNKLLRCLKKVNILDSKVTEEQQNHPLIIYADFESISVPENMGSNIQKFLYLKISKIFCWLV